MSELPPPEDTPLRSKGGPQNVPFKTGFANSARVGAKRGLRSGSGPLTPPVGLALGSPPVTPSKPTGKPAGAPRPGRVEPLPQKPNSAPTTGAGDLLMLATVPQGPGTFLTETNVLGSPSSLPKRKPLIQPPNRSGPLAPSQTQPQPPATAAEKRDEVPEATLAEAPKGKKGSKTVAKAAGAKVGAKAGKAAKEKIEGTAAAKSSQPAAPPQPACKGALSLKHSIKCKTAFEETVFSVRYSPDGKWVAASTGDGALHVFSSGGKFQRKVRTAADASGEDLPCVAVRWRPVGKASKEEGVALCACSNGSVQRVNLITGKHMDTIWEKGNEVLAVDYSPDGAMFASAGNDRIVRLYNEETRQCTALLQSGIDYQGRITAGHANRICCVRFAEIGTNVLLSGGWDNTIQVYDVRTNRSVRTLFGAKVSGDALDIRGPLVLAASCRIEQQIGLYDWSNGKQIPTEHLSRAVGESSLYAAKFGSTPQQCWVTGTQPHIVLGLDIKTGNVVGSFRHAPESLFALDVSPDGRSAVVGGSHEALYFMDVSAR